MRHRAMRRATLLLSALATGLSACAGHPDGISARYVSPVAYQAYSCDQLNDERRRLGGEVDRVAGLQRENATGDAVLLTVGLVIFWPALIGMAATKDRKEELSRVKGEYDAVDAQARMKQCALPVPPPVLPAVPATTPQTAIAAASPPAQDIVLAATPTPPPRRSLGLEVLAMDDTLASATRLAQPQGIYVKRVLADGAAASGGLRENDVILDFATAPVATIADMQRALSEIRAGTQVPLTVWRDQRRVQAQLAF